MLIRRAASDDLPALATLYAQTVRTHGPSLYSSAQVDAWASAGTVNERFHDFVFRPTTFVAQDEHGPAGFAGIEADGHVQSLYVRADCTRRGIGTALMRHVFNHARSLGIESLYTEASQFSRPLFERLGFSVDHAQHVTYAGVSFERWVMRCRLMHEHDASAE